MYGLAYVLIPPRFTSLQAELDRALAPFERGGPERWSFDQLTFDDCTGFLRAAHDAEVALTLDGGRLSLRDFGSNYTMFVHLAPVQRWLEARGGREWRGALREIEPDFERFAADFTRVPMDEHTGRFGRWLNALGEWDWWELGGRFNGWVSGDPRPPATDDHFISSGPSPGRSILGNLGRALCDELDPERGEAGEAEIEANVEPASALFKAASEERNHAWPSAIVLPTDAGPAAGRWIDQAEWKKTRPDACELLALQPGATFRETVLAAYERFHDHAVAGVAYHL